MSIVRPIFCIVTLIACLLYCKSILENLFLLNVFINKSINAYAMTLFYAEFKLKKLFFTVYLK